MNKYDVSIILPGIRSENWERVYKELGNACFRHSFELIIASPCELPIFFADKKNVKFIRDFGCPSRVFQMASMLCEGEFTTHVIDDAIIGPASIDESIDLLRSKDSSKDIVCMRYAEGMNYAQGVEFPNEYWTSWFHFKESNLLGIDKDWKLACVMLLGTEYFRSLGGIDCVFEHTNMNLHDFVFRAQRNGSVVYLSPKNYCRVDWDPRRNEKNSAIVAAYFNNDLPLFQSIYATKENADKREIKINYMNWLGAPTVWERRQDKTLGI